MGGPGSGRKKGSGKGLISGGSNKLLGKLVNKAVLTFNKKKADRVEKAAGYTLYRATRPK
jgi:hypothetical protein